MAQIDSTASPQLQDMGNVHRGGLTQMKISLLHIRALHNGAWPVGSKNSVFKTAMVNRSMKFLRSAVLILHEIP